MWRSCRGGGLGSPGHLPFAGGAAEQPSALMAALDSMMAAQAAVEARRRR